MGKNNRIFVDGAGEHYAYSTPHYCGQTCHWDDFANKCVCPKPLKMDSKLIDEGNYSFVGDIGGDIYVK